MKQEGISGEGISIESQTGYIVSDRNGTISYNGTHDAIKVRDTIYDNLNPNGISYSDWLKDLGITDFPWMFSIETTLIN